MSDTGKPARCDNGTATIIRPEHPDDYAAIDEVNRLAFGQDDEGRLISRLRGIDGFDPALSLVAVRGHRVVGHILFSPIHIETDHGDVPALALAPMAVLPECQRQGIGSGLVREGLERSRKKGHSVVAVVGHAEYYPRFGFTPATQYGLRSPFPVPDEAFMAIALASNGLDAVSGVVRYSTPFNEV